jgi:hydrogenase/urease accessory protein HupE
MQEFLQKPNWHEDHSGQPRQGTFLAGMVVAGWRAFADWGDNSVRGGGISLASARLGSLGSGASGMTCCRPQNRGEEGFGMVVRSRWGAVQAVGCLTSFLTACIVMTSVGWAHDPGLSTAQGHLRAGTIEITTGFAPADVQEFLPPEVRSFERWEQSDFEAVRDLLEAIVPQLWEASIDGTALPPAAGRVELLPADNVSFHVAFPVPDEGRLTLRAPRLSELPPTHRQFVLIFDEAGSIITRKLLNARDNAVEVSLGKADGSQKHFGDADRYGAPTAWEFIKLGIEHIWTGFDHLLFLLALLVVCRSFRSIVAIVSCFTLAHSLTLAAATLDWVNFPARLVEPAIAASIVYVGAENLWRGGEEPRGRWLLTFVFGLVHGFGFASVLRDLGVGAGAGSVVMPLLTFNLGVEIGQIVIAAVVLPIIWQLRKREQFVRRGVPFLSVAVGAAGMYWLLDRTVFG